MLGDQLCEDSSAFDGFDPALDTVWMAEVKTEATYVWSHKARIALFLSAMRHFRDAIQKKGTSVEYHTLDGSQKGDSLGSVLRASIRKLDPEHLVVVEPGEWRVRQSLKKVAEETGVPFEIRPDRHFLCSQDQFAEHVEGRKSLVMEFFYREMRRGKDVLMAENKPTGGKWNYDADNRDSFGKAGPKNVPPPVSFEPDSTTRSVIKLVEKYFPEHPGTLKKFDWAVTPQQAQRALRDFIENRLKDFGKYQDAMWTGETFLYHSRLSSALNLKLLDPRRAIEAAVGAFEKKQAPLNSVEGFIRQILGWREYVRGIYWRFMPQYADGNELGADSALPQFYWNAETDMNCLHECIRQTLDYGFAHHIQRLMVTGLFALLFGVRPQEAHKWYLAIYVDAVEWVELPNTLGMSQFADGGIMATKPYAATGAYIDRMSNYCEYCRYAPSERIGDNACPFTTLYWDFLMRNESRLKNNRRMNLQLRNLRCLEKHDRQTIRKQADNIRKKSI